MTRGLGKKHARMVNQAVYVLQIMTVGIAIADLVTHPEGLTEMLWGIECSLDNRCPVCGYKYTHPIVRHLGNRGVECGWR